VWVMGSETIKVSKQQQQTGYRFISLLFALCIAALFLQRCAQENLSDALSNDICSDDFNRADSDTLGGNWDVLINYPQTQPPEVKISDNRAYFKLPYVTPMGISRLTSIVCKNRVEQPRSKVSVEIVRTAGNITTGNQIILYSRYQDSSNAYGCVYKSQTLGIARLLGTTITNFSTSGNSFPIQANIPAIITFTSDGSSLSCTLEHNGAIMQVAATDSTFMAGKTGVFAVSQSAPFDFYADNLKTEILP